MNQKSGSPRLTQIRRKRAQNSAPLPNDSDVGDHISLSSKGYKNVYKMSILSSS